MVFSIRAISLVLFVQVMGDNLETRIHRLISPTGDLGYEFGTSMTSLRSTNRLIIGSPKQTQNSLYSCSYTFTGKTTSRLECNTFINNEKIIGYGTSISKLPTESAVLACSNQYMFSCPNGTIEQRMIGECRSINPTTGTSYRLLTPCPIGCPQGLVADIVFLMDGSGSVGSTNFRKGLDWIVEVLQRFSYDIDLRNVQSGYVLFDHKVYDTSSIRPRSFYDLKGSLRNRWFHKGTTECLLNVLEKCTPSETQNDNAALVSLMVECADQLTIHIQWALPHLSIEKINNYGAGGTATNKAIDEGAKLLESSPRTVPKVMITITDGASNNAGLTTTSAFNARNKGIIMIAVGVGNANEQELGRIANGNSFSSERVMTVTNYDNLDSILDELSQVIKESASIAPEGSGNGTTELTNCQFGTSVSATTNGIYIGAPGSFDRVGTVAEYTTTGFPEVASKGHLNDSEIMEITGKAATLLRDAYLGYSTCVGKFESGDAGWIVSGLPRYLSRGAVLIYRRDEPNLHTFLLHPNTTSVHWQLGGYYGHSVLAMDLNNDGYDDVLVSEPLYSETAGYDEGLVFVYMNDKSQNAVRNWISQDNPTLLRGSDTSAARFGMSIINAGDLDRNGYNDVIIGAPNEKSNGYTDSSGAIYIYYSSENGINCNRFQRVLGESLEATTTLKNFGWFVQGGLDVDNNNYPDVAVSAPSSDSVVLLKSRRLIVTTMTLTTNPQVIDILSCATTSATCFQVTACLSAQYLDSPRGEKFSMVHNITADSLVSNTISRRLIFKSSKTDIISTADIEVGQTPPICNTYELQLNLQSLGKINSGGFEITPRIKFTADLAPTHKANVMSGVLGTTNTKTTDLSFNTGCNNGICYHDLQISVNYSIPMSSIPLRLDGSNRILTVSGKIFNAGPNQAFFLKVNISSGNLTINRVSSSCVIISEDESDANRGETVLRYYSGSSVLRDTMKSGSTCQFSIDFDFTRIQFSSQTSEVKIHGTVYSNAGSTAAIDSDGGNNDFSYSVPLQYESNLILRAISAPESVFFQPPSDDTTISIKTLEDKILGGKVSNFLHRYTIYNTGPLGLGYPRVRIQWPEKTVQGYDLIYLVGIHCETEDGQISRTCSCDDKNLANKYEVAPNENLRGEYYQEYTLIYPKESDAIRTSDKLTCDNSLCNAVYCDINLVDRHQQITIVAAFKPWTPSFHKEFVKAVVETSMKIIPSNLTALPIFDTNSVTSSLSSYDPENPPPQPTPKTLNIGAIIGGIIAGLVLLAIAMAVMWKVGFFKSKYGKMTREARKSIRESRRTGGEGGLEGDSASTNPKSYGSTVDLIDE